MARPRKVSIMCHQRDCGLVVSTTVRYRLAKWESSRVSLTKDLATLTWPMTSAKRPLARSIFSFLTASNFCQRFEVSAVSHI